MMIFIKNGALLPLGKDPEQAIYEIPPIQEFGIQMEDYNNFPTKPLIKEGDFVARGEPLCSHSKYPEILITSPRAGKVEKILYDQNLSLSSISLRASNGKDESINFPEYSDQDLKTLSQFEIKKLILESGLWPAFRTRPFSHIPSPKKSPRSIFITATPCYPGPIRPDLIIKEREKDFLTGLGLVAKLAEEKVFLCKTPQYKIQQTQIPKLEIIDFRGPSPSELPGTHIHFLDRIVGEKEVWHINFQEVIAIGHLFATGQIRFDRVVTLFGPDALRPRAIKTFYGAHLKEITRNEINSPLSEVISGSLLNGKRYEANHQFLGRYHYQVSLLTPTDQKPHSIFSLQNDNFSLRRSLYYKLFNRNKFTFDSSSFGLEKSFYPSPLFQKIFPLKLEINLLLDSLVKQNVQKAIQLGILELDEEDLSLCTYICPAKINYAPLLRSLLNKITVEGLHE